LVEIGHREVRVAATKPGTGLAYGDGKFFEIVVGVERLIESDKVNKGGGEEGIFVVIQSRYMQEKGTHVGVRRRGEGGSKSSGALASPVPCSTRPCPVAADHSTTT